jgi:hypothetical protein
MGYALNGADKQILDKRPMSHNETWEVSAMAVLRWHALRLNSMLSLEESSFVFMVDHDEH